MWAQLITMRLKPGSDTAGLDKQFRAAEQPRQGLVRTLMMHNQKDPSQVYALVVFRERGQSTRAQAVPRRQEKLQAARAMMADIFDGPPQFTDLTVDNEWTGLA